MGNPTSKIVTFNFKELNRSSELVLICSVVVVVAVAVPLIVLLSAS